MYTSLFSDLKVGVHYQIEENLWNTKKIQLEFPLKILLSSESMKYFDFLTNK